MSRAHSYSHSTAHSPTFPPLHLHHSSFSNTSFALPTSQLILQFFLCFTYVTVHSPTLLSPILRHKLFTQYPGDRPMCWRQERLEPCIMLSMSRQPREDNWVATYKGGVISHLKTLRRPSVNYQLYNYIMRVY